jgi:hypothetical protein
MSRKTHFDFGSSVGDSLSIGPWGGGAVDECLLQAGMKSWLWEHKLDSIEGTVASEPALPNQGNDDNRMVSDVFWRCRWRVGWRLPLGALSHI